MGNLCKDNGFNCSGRIRRNNLFNLFSFTFPYGHISGSASLILWMLVLLKAWSTPGTSIDQLRTEWKMKKEKKYHIKKPAIEDMKVKTKIEG
jgi:hypothetical protein